MNLVVRSVEQSAINAVDFSNLSFGNIFTDHMLICDFDGENWGDIYIQPLSDFSFHPATSVLHYGQAIFEGLKAYLTTNGKINLFRVDDNLKRLQKSAERMAMPCPPVEITKNAILEWLKLEKKWVPKKSEGTLYVRPFIIATGNTLRAIPSSTFRFAVIGSPVGFYYNQPISVKLENHFKRAAPGGTGSAKAAGNYAGAFAPTLAVKYEGFDQLLWTDVSENQYIEELGSANFFIRTEDALITPPTSSTILSGITRDTILKIAIESGMKVEEKRISKLDLITMLSKNKIISLFASGTAAAVTYINRIAIDDQEFLVSSDNDVAVQQLKHRLDSIRFGMEPDPFGWCNII